MPTLTSTSTSTFPLPTTFPYLSRVRLSCESYEPSRTKYLSTKTCLEPSICAEPVSVLVPENVNAFHSRTLPLPGNTGRLTEY